MQRVYNNIENFSQKSEKLQLGLSTICIKISYQLRIWKRKRKENRSNKHQRFAFPLIKSDYSSSLPQWWDPINLGVLNSTLSQWSSVCAETRSLLIKHQPLKCPAQPRWLVGTCRCPVLFGTGKGNKGKEKRKIPRDSVPSCPKTQECHLKRRSGP